MTSPQPGVPRSRPWTEWREELQEADAIISEANCMLCLIALTSGKNGNRSEEHVFPQWYLRRAGGEKARTLQVAGAQSSSVQGHKDKVPMCKACNNALGAKYEKPISEAFEDGQLHRVSDEDFSFWALLTITKAFVSAHLRKRDASPEEEGQFRSVTGLFLVALRFMMQKNGRLATKSVSLARFETWPTAPFHSVDSDPPMLTLALNGQAVIATVDGGFSAQAMAAVTNVVQGASLSLTQLRDISLSLAGYASVAQPELELSASREARLSARRKSGSSALSRWAAFDISAPNIGLALRGGKIVSSVLPTPRKRSVILHDQMNRHDADYGLILPAPVISHADKTTPFAPVTASHLFITDPRAAAEMAKDFGHQIKKLGTGQRRECNAGESDWRLAMSILTGDYEAALELCGRLNFNVAERVTQIWYTEGVGWHAYTPPGAGYQIVGVIRMQRTYDEDGDQILAPPTFGHDFQPD